MGPRLFRYYAVGMLLFIGAYLFTPGGWAETVWQVTVGWLAAGFAVLGVRRYRPPVPAAWLCFAAGVFLNASGILAEAITTKVFHHEGHPAAADAFWLALYPGLVVGAVLLIRRRTSERDWSTFVDSTTVMTGLGLLSWIFVIRPQAADPTLGLLGRAVVSAYPVGDVVVLGMLVRILLGGGARQAALRYLLASMLVFLVGDIIWVASYHTGWEPAGRSLHLVQMDFLVAFALVGAACLHPSVREVGQPVPPRQIEISPVLLTSLTAASLVAPALLATQAVKGEVTDGVAIALTSTMLFILVVTRMIGLLRRVQTQARQLRELVRVDELTGLPNRRAWSTELPMAIERARRDRVPLSVAMIDLDHFKRFNDLYGHPAGDRHLKATSAAWRQEIRAMDQLARYGGEEFILLLPSADSAGVMDVLDRLRPVVPAGQTFSAGVATWDGSESSEELIVRADAALYRAKENGRNQTMVARESIQPLTR